MARQPKQGLDYYPRDVDFLRDRKFRKVRMKYGAVAVMVYEALLDLIYADRGYYIDYGDSNKDDVIWEVSECLQGKYQPSHDTIAEVIEDLVDCELFSEYHFNSKIITSKRIQRTYYSATVERKAIQVNFDIWMLSESEMSELSGCSTILQNFKERPNNEVNRPNNEVNRPNNTQSKVKESKVKESKVNNDSPEQQAAQGKTHGIVIIELSLNDGSSHQVFEQQTREWGELYPAVNILQELRKMKGWCDSNPKKRKTGKGINRFINNWLAGAQDRGGAGHGESFGRTDPQQFTPSSGFRG